MIDIGDEVIALTTPENDFSQKRIRGSEYKVTGILECPKGCKLVNIDNTPASIDSKIVSCNCNMHHDNGGLAWTFVDHFVKREDIPKALDKALGVEDYATAILLRDLNK